MMMIQYSLLYTDINEIDFNLKIFPFFTMSNNLHTATLHNNSMILHFKLIYVRNKTLLNIPKINKFNIDISDNIPPLRCLYVGDNYVMIMYNVHIHEHTIKIKEILKTPNYFKNKIIQCIPIYNSNYSHAWYLNKDDKRDIKWWCNDTK